MSAQARSGRGGAALSKARGAEALPDTVELDNLRVEWLKPLPLLPGHRAVPRPAPLKSTWDPRVDAPREELRDASLGLLFSVRRGYAHPGAYLECVVVSEALRPREPVFATRFVVEDKSRHAARVAVYGLAPPDAALGRLGAATDCHGASGLQSEHSTKSP